VKSTNGSIDYRNAVLAAPIHTSRISLPESLAIQVPERPHETIFTTVLVTNASRPDPTYFGLNPAATAPRTILTTVGKGGEEPEFLSLKYYSVIQRGDQEEYVVKILSQEKLSEESLEQLFGPESVKWIYTHEVCVIDFPFGAARAHSFNHVVEDPCPFADNDFSSYQTRQRFLLRQRLRLRGLHHRVFHSVRPERRGSSPSRGLFLCGLRQTCPRTICRTGGVRYSVAASETWICVCVWLGLLALFPLSWSISLCL
jgi:hypothetical protein